MKSTVILMLALLLAKAGYAHTPVSWMLSINPRADVNLVTTVKRIATSQNLDPRLVLAIIKKESTFKPHVISPDGSYGLMQVRKHVHLAQLIKDGNHNLLDPTANIRAGTKILRAYIDKYATLRKALSAYSGGSSKYADKVLAIYKEVPHY